ncbi:uncharacterized protein KY384_008514 [Bacidia gigantensis]|uniref:uncharacterized protein n=1 Tax=Bacidia gigantensis TaxID=2732470 RepID=UPI001D03A547|nr:uncharacterized protein KY384_008514 [Bacidia gigantensis]KAG8527085.1 hypothetical protein KY384_008514 [Bacidia gigantensis]
MGRRKIEIKAIKDDRNRSVTFLKRKGGLFKKAHELSVLCSVDVAVIIFGHNKKLYEYSSGDINDTITRFTYYNGPHEHKGPADFAGGMDDDDDDDMGSPPLEDTMPRQGSLPPHLQQQQSYMRGSTATPPPMANGINYHQRQQTPQPHIISRPGSSNAIRRSSSNVGPSHLQQVTQAPTTNGYTYMRTAPVQPYQGPHGMPPTSHQNPNPTGTQVYYNQLQQASQQVYSHEPRRQSVPPTFPQQDQRQYSGQPSQPSPPQIDQRRTQDDQSNRLQQPKATKSRSIFTPIDDSRSLLAQHWGGGKPTTEPKPEIKKEQDSLPHSNTPPDSTSHQQPQPVKAGSPPTQAQERPAPRRTASNDFVPPIRTDSAAGAKRPKLKVHIPEEQSEAEEESAKNQSGSKDETPAKASEGNNSHSSGTGVVLPPPSPSASASAVLSAGASGPPNPFARPLPPQNTAQQHNSTAFERNRGENMETPISALPSRFVADGLLPSPSSFYPDWGFGRSGADSANILPSPLNFQTPVNGTGPSFARDEDGEKKRKTPEGEGQETSAPKRVKA